MLSLSCCFQPYLHSAIITVCTLLCSCNSHFFYTRFYTNLVDKAKQAYYSAKIQSSTTCKQLFQNFNTILGKSRSSPLPSTFDSDDLLNVFSDYFTEKIRTIRNNFPPPNPTACPDTSFAGNPLLTFESVTDEFVLKIINSASAKSCELDPIPTTLLYENLDILLPTITNIINTSLTTGIVPLDLKTAIVKPLLKKPSLDKNLLKNYRPISNLPFLSKILEKVVLHKLLSHLQENNLSNPFQSAYRAGCSTETILLCIVNDILSTLDNDNISVLLLLDHSAAFDTWPPNSPLPPELCFWHSVYCTPVVSVIPLRQVSVHFSQ